MSKVLEVYWAVVLTGDGVTDVLAGSLTTPQKSVTVTDGKNVRALTIPMDASESNKVAWTWTDTEGFEFAIFWVLDDGYVNAGVQVDTATSEANQSPTGTTPRWMHRNLSCVGPMIIDTDRAYTHATAGTVSGDSAGNPTLWADGSKVSGVVSKIEFRNPGTDALTVKGLVIQ